MQMWAQAARWRCVLRRYEREVHAHALLSEATEGGGGQSVVHVRDAYSDVDFGAPAPVRARGCVLASVPPTSAPGLGRPLPHLRRDWGSPLPRLRRDFCAGVPELAGHRYCTVMPDGERTLQVPVSTP